MDWTINDDSGKTQNAMPSFNSFRDGTLSDNTDDYIVGDRVWVNGRKSGYIQYLGETQFASGDWAGVVLDEPIGKNDGSVAGIRYFQCEPRRGVFARLHRLTRYPITPPTKYDVHTAVNGSTSKTTTTKVMNSPKGTKTVVTTSTTVTSPSKSPRLRIADRVLVNSSSGIRTGVLRYLGPTAFASGQWAGVELDEPVGKNDGSVAGKRYFDCRMKYGLFAPIHKITKISGSYARATSPILRSHESLTTSTTSSRTTMKSASPVISSVQATTTAMQEALKEKEEHLEQLLRERDLERAEIARAASEIKQAEQNLETLQLEHDQYMEQSEYNIAYLRQLLDESEQERKELTARLEEERRKVEDLQFRIEEETIIKHGYRSNSDNSDDDDENKVKAQKEVNNEDEKVGETSGEEDKDELIKKLQRELDDRESQMMQMNATLQETQLKLEQLTDSYVSRNKINNHISELQAENILLIKEKNDILERWEEAEKMKGILEQERDQLLRERAEQQAAVCDRDLQVAQLKAEVERLRLEFAQHKEHLKQQLEQTEVETRAMQDLHQQLVLERDALDELQNELRQTTSERNQYKREITILRSDYEALKKIVEDKKEEIAS
ncbi:CAP-Gly domain-containing linker protein 1-like isoform X1 [Centruroides sculpturatus]|uniref:CAP-Gly domain-containing linker protein 1-like isoform X1 n=1 Tax=Centruroides sculpturatus TaxID=218467 RepID=UPI000C6ECAFF|nr:CAP-Gly domain-containing linker protein 1-like isoform X1 [Centruroides sculpturatus]